ncbi:MAG: hypothetical protein J7M38_01185, partial [Armatimonadetes bacterium]|nr:hypothetical protein [Armatimonadota bacterium]
PPPATTGMTDVYTSAYLKDGRALLIIANLGREPRAGTITVNPEALGMTALSAQSWPDDQPLEMKGNAFPVALEGLDWKMVLLSPK